MPALRFEPYELSNFTLDLAYNRVDLLAHSLKTFKARAKTLQKELKAYGTAISLMTVQEALAKALGFANTHGLQQTVANIHATRPTDPSERFKWKLSDSQARVAATACVLNEDFTGCLPLNTQTLSRLDAIAENLASHLQLTAAQVRQALALAWAGELSWTRLSSRTPFDSVVAEPLVSFECIGDPTSSTSRGVFYYSTEAHWVWDNIIGSTPNRVYETPESRRVAYQEAMRVAEWAPELLPAWACASNLMADHHDELGGTWGLAIKLIDQGIKAAEKFILKGFKGTLSWYDTDNRRYLQALNFKMQLLLRSVIPMRDATKLADKMLRLCPQDNMGVREIHPLLCAITKGDTPSTRKSIRRALATAGPASKLNAGVAQLLLKQPEGLVSFLQGIFEVPEFGAILLDQPEVRPYGPYSRRPQGYEDPYPETLAVFYVIDNSPLGAWLIEILKDPYLLAEEKRLEALIDDNARTKRWEAWWPEAPRAAATMAEDLFNRHPGLRQWVESTN